jgi:hypothetical protein
MRRLVLTGLLILAGCVAPDQLSKAFQAESQSVRPPEDGGKDKCVPPLWMQRKQCYRTAHAKEKFCDGLTGDKRQSCRDLAAQELEFCLQDIRCEP